MRLQPKLSFQVAHLLAKQAKPFVDDVLVKLCLTAEAKETCPQKINLFKIISLLMRTVAQKVENTGICQ